MPQKKTLTRKSTEKARKEYLRLRRAGARGEGGLGRYYFDGKLYKRGGIYAASPAQAGLMVSTGHFERIHQDDLEAARGESGQPRGLNLSDRTRVRRREATARRRRESVLVDDAGAVDDSLLDTGAAEVGAGGEGDESDKVSV